jgi:hypothetical protein
MALMDGAPDAALVFCAHTGYERTARLEDFIAGGLYRTIVKVKFWRVPASAVPTDPAARAAFLHAEWRKVDAWVAKHATPPAQLSPSPRGLPQPALNADLPKNAEGSTSASPRRREVWSQELPEVFPSPR